MVLSCLVTLFSLYLLIRILRLINTLKELTDFMMQHFLPRCCAQHALCPYIDSENNHELYQNVIFQQRD